ncbi:MAG: 5'/3'-nucleotidase SurE [Alphaproteobacteria bacterium]|nr:5'/3'-nucleotidase SurE [Alphaproteobacteria bacterium]
MSGAGRLKRVLLTNDDGFDAPGLAALADVARQLADEVWIVAPQLDQSGMGQSITMNGPLRCIPRGDKQFAISGTPADCVILALQHLMQTTPPDLILSGVNAGNNTGDDFNLSGTIGAAFTGLMLGTPAIAISLDCASRKHLRWDTARAVLPKTLTHFLNEGWDKNHCLSINLPDLPPEKTGGVSMTVPAQKTIRSFLIEKREDLREKDYFWLYPQSNEQHAAEGTDLAALARGQISVSLLQLDRSVAR